MKRTIISILFILAYMVNSISASMNFQTLDVKTGLSDNYIQCILKDSYGFMWFATHNGLNRYDGYHVKLYTTVETGAYNNNVEWLDEDAAGMIWMKTPVGFCYYDRECDKIKNDIGSILGGYGITGHVKQIFVDQNKNLWCQTTRYLYRYSFTNKNLQKISLTHSFDILDLTAEGAHIYLLTNNGKIYSLDHHLLKLTYETQITIRKSERHSIYLDHTHNLWIYASYCTELRCYSTKEHRYIPFPGNNEVNMGNNIMSVVDDGQGNIWIGTDSKGVYKINLSNHRCQNIRKEQSKRFSLPSNHITCFFCDHRGMTWIGTSKNGVAYLIPASNAFENVYLKDGEDVSCFMEYPQGNLWMGFDGEGLGLAKNDNDNYTTFRTDNSHVPSNTIVCAFTDSRHRIWWGSFGQGAFYHDGGVFRPLKELVSKGSELPTFVRRITEDRYGNIWFATYTQGIFCLDRNGTLTNYTTTNSKLNTQYIADLSVGRGNNLYIATSSGLYRQNLTTKIIESIQKDRNGQNMIQDNSINCIYLDSRGFLWLGGREELAVFNPADNSIRHFPKVNGLFYPYTHIRAIIEDKRHNLWVSTEYGVTLIHVIYNKHHQPLKFQFSPYDASDGIGIYGFNNFAICCNNKNEIYVGGNGGYTKIDADRFTYRYRQYRPVFTALYLSDKRIEAGIATNDGRIILKRNILMSKEITLDYYDSNFSIEISALDYANSNKIQYLYRLSKSDEWIRAEGNRISFNKLASGTYDMEVIVHSPSYGNSHPSHLIIHIRPPFWLSLPAYLFYAAIISLGIFYLFRRMQKKHQEAMEIQRKELESEQQQQMYEAKMRFFTNASHDLRTPLSLILLPLEKLLASKKAAPVKEDLELMQRNATSLMNEIDQMLDFQRLDQNKIELSYSYGDITKLISEVFDQSSIIASKRNIKMEKIINTEAIEMFFDHDKMCRILHNLISNAIKYNVENGNILVSVDKIDSNGTDWIEIKVADTGIGIKNENKEKVFGRFYQESPDTTTYTGIGIGLSIVEEFVKLHGGHIDVTDNQPHGCVFVIQLPIKTERKANKTEERKDTLMPLMKAEQTDDHPTNDQKTKILMVEDNDDFRQFMVKCLQEHYQVYEASNGAHAIELLEKESVHLIISDVMMPVMDGMELCHRIKTDLRFSHIPMILLTARSSNEHIANGLREGADDYITKPFSMEILLLKINNILKWTQDNYLKFKTIDVSPSDITVSSLDAQLIEKAIHTVEENMDNADFSVEDLSASVNMSRGYLYKKLILITGKSPLEFIRIIRVKRGKQLLEQSQQNISQIAYQIGLSPKQFAKYFKEEYGKLPSEYNKN